MTENIVRMLWTYQTDEGTFLVASKESPRFCFEGATEEEVLAKADRALVAYSNNEFRPIAKEPVASKVLFNPRPIRTLVYTPGELATA